MAADFGPTKNNLKLENFIIISVVTLLFCWFFFWVRKRRDELLLPPGPRGLPLVGFIPFLRPHHLHRLYTELAGTYGPIFSLRLGHDKLRVVLTSPSLVKEIFRDHDAAFANRDRPTSVTGVSYGSSGLLFSPHGPAWRLLRKICVTEIMATPRLECSSSKSIRRREIRELVRDVSLKVGTPVDVGERAFAFVFNVLFSTTIWGGELHGSQAEKLRISGEFREVLEEMLQLLGTPDVSDFFPLIARFDMQRIAQRLKRTSEWLEKILEDVINERLMKVDEEEYCKSHGDEDVLQKLLKLYKEGADRGGDEGSTLSLTQIKGLIIDLLMAGTDTTSRTIEWAMAHMLKDPDIMKAALEELDRKVGLHQTVEESHLPNLNYLNAVVKEAMRLYPAVAVTPLRCPSQTCVVGGYVIPKDAKVGVNVWAIHRDPRLWDDPLEFRPERFMADDGQNLDFSGNDFRYIPFGSGRRKCVGVHLAERMIMSVLASLLHSFLWRLPEGNSKLDMSEELRIVMKKTNPLVAVPSPRLSDPRLYD